MFRFRHWNITRSRNLSTGVFPTVPSSHNRTGVGLNADTDFHNFFWSINLSRKQTDLDHYEIWFIVFSIFGTIMNLFVLVGNY